MTVHMHHGDLPGDYDFGAMVAVDSETMGLNPHRDRLCLVQMSAGDGNCHLVKIAQGQTEAPNLKRLMEDPAVTKLFHFARFDIAVLRQRLGIHCTPVYCTKIVSKLVRTYTGGHGLKDLARELLGVEMSKVQQSSDWGAEEITEAQQQYAANDVLYLHQIHARLDAMLDREGRRHLAEAAFRFLPVRAELDLAGWAEDDIFAHS